MPRPREKNTGVFPACKKPCTKTCIKLLRIAGKTFNFDLKGSMMASDAFFPFPDCIEIASQAGIEGIVQPGGSIKDDLSINACDKLNISMYLTGTRHFYH